MRPKILLAMAATWFIWGSTYLFTALAVRDLPPFLLASPRMKIAALRDLGIDVDVDALAGDRFDRQIAVENPDMIGRHRILAVEEHGVGEGVVGGAETAREEPHDHPQQRGLLVDRGAQRLVPEHDDRGLLERTRVQRKTRAPFFIDKMPNNFRHVGLIHLILPNARIIDARRDPMACCFSNFKQLFAQGQEFTYGIEDIARYYRTYVELMDHWDAVLPGRVLRVQHEDVIDDLEGSVRRILDYCGLPFAEACVEFHKTKRSVRTPSSEQVRQPIFREGTEAWKPYEPWLDPLKVALGDVLNAYPAVPDFG